MSCLFALLRSAGATALMFATLSLGSNAYAISDPIEPISRAMFTFNNLLFDYIADPVGGFGQDWLSPGIRQAVLSEAVCPLGVAAGPLSGDTGLSLVSTWLVAADLVIDGAIAAALLRHSADPVNEDSSDPYFVRRLEYYRYIETACTLPEGVKPAW